jgi:hypothetical protein
MKMMAKKSKKIDVERDDVEDKLKKRELMLRTMLKKTSKLR